MGKWDFSRCCFKSCLKCTSHVNLVPTYEGKSLVGYTCRSCIFGVSPEPKRKSKSKKK